MSSRFVKRLLRAGAAVSVLALAAVPAVARTSAAPRTAHGAAAAGPAIQLPAMNLRTRTLANGLTVYSVRDPNTANVSVQVWYRVGSKDDPQGRSGFAHLFEHLMFKATRNLPADSFDHLTDEVGGFNNASTYDDYTNYYETVPSNHLERLLFAEADRMNALVVEPAVVASERDVVKEELRYRVLSSPYGRLFYLYLPQESYDQHPYRRPGIGSIANLEAATIDDVRAFHATYYRPDNAYLIVVGDFDDAQLDRWIDQYFAPVARPARPLPVNNVAEPRRTASREVTYYAPNVPLPAVALTFQAPGRADPDGAALTVLDGILSAGDHSRLHQALVYQQQIAAQTSSTAKLQTQAGSFYLYAILSQGHTVAEGRAALMAEIARLRDQPVTDQELQEAKNELVASALRDRETVDDRGNLIGEGLMAAGDPRFGDVELERIQRVTAADVQRVAREYLRDDGYVAISYLPESMKPEGTPSEPRQAAVEAPIQVADLAPSGTPVTLAPEGERAALPPVAPERPVTTPQVSERRLANGLRVIVAPTSGVPLVSARLGFTVGTADDPQGRAGVAALTASLVTEGTDSLSAPEVATQIESLGAVIGAGAGVDSSSLYGNSPAAVFPQTLALMSQIALHPAFAEAELQRKQAETLDGLRLAMSQPASVGGMVAGRVIYGDAPYGTPGSGTLSSVPAITVGDVRAFHDGRWVPSRATLVFSGDITPARAFALAEQYFGAWRGPADSPPRVDRPAGPVLPPRVVVIDQPGGGQAAVLAVARSVNRTSADYYPLLLGNVVLGSGGLSSRMNVEVRVKRGLSYGVSSSIGTRADTGIFTASAQTRNDAAPQVAELLMTEIARMVSAPPGEEELAPQRAQLVGGFARSLETVDGLGSLVAGYALSGLPLSELHDYAPHVRGVTAAQVQDAFSRDLAPGQFSLVIIGDAAQFLPALRQRYPDLEVIPLTDLKLDNATLR